MKVCHITLELESLDIKNGLIEIIQPHLINRFLVVIGSDLY